MSNEGSLNKTETEIISAPLNKSKHPCWIEKNRNDVGPIIGSSCVILSMRRQRFLSNVNLSARVCRQTGKRTCPFMAFVSYPCNDRLVLAGTVIVVAIWLAGYSRDERLQYATKSWIEVDSSIASLEVRHATAFNESRSLCSAGMRFKSQIAELTPACFSNLQLQHPSLLYNRSPSEVPVLIGFSKHVVCVSCHLLVGMLSGCPSLRLLGLHWIRSTAGQGRTMIVQMIASSCPTRFTPGRVHFMCVVLPRTCGTWARCGLFWRMRLQYWSAQGRHSTSRKAWEHIVQWTEQSLHGRSRWICAGCFTIGIAAGQL